MTTETIRLIALSIISESDNNPRRTYNQASLQELADSLRTVGLQQPVVVRSHPRLTGFEAIFGHRRLRAAKLAGWDEIECIVREMSDEAADLARLHENLEREDVHYVEEAEAMARLIHDHGISAETLAEQTGKGLTYVYGRLKLARLHPIVRERLLAHPDWSPETVVLVARVPTSLQPAALERITLGNSKDETASLMSYRSARETLRAGYTLQLAAAPWHGRADMLAACHACPRATHNDPAFADAPAGLCTDPDCWKSKQAEHEQTELEALRSAGRVIEASDDAPALLATWQYVPAPGGQHMPLDKLIQEAEAAGIEVPKHALVADDKTRVGLTQEDATQLSDALAKHHGMPTYAEARAAAPQHQSAIEEDDDDNPLLELPPQERAVAFCWQEVKGALMGAMAAGQRTEQDLPLMVHSLIQTSYVPDLVHIMRLIGWGDALDAVEDRSDDDLEQFALEQASKASHATLAVLVLLAALDAENARPISHTGQIDTALLRRRLALAQAYGVDPVEAAGEDLPAGTNDQVDQADLFAGSSTAANAPAGNDTHGAEEEEAA